MVRCDLSLTSSICPNGMTSIDRRNLYLFSWQDESNPLSDFVRTAFGRASLLWATDRRDVVGDTYLFPK